MSLGFMHDSMWGLGMTADFNKNIKKEQHTKHTQIPLQRSLVFSTHNTYFFTPLHVKHVSRGGSLINRMGAWPIQFLQK